TAEAYRAEGEHVAALEHAESARDREGHELDAGSEGVDHEGTHERGTDPQPHEHEIDLEAAHDPAEEVDENAADHCAGPPAIGGGERWVHGNQRVGGGSGAA